ncbi:hypothetical protein Lnau_1965 [Legionella nautarum]|uniref:Uncharacterized protein n=1 Tax=Legionella nautarum TaxID=45070 RepID=A0A0W0WRX6_9GAMM|nr:hypothetical protein [Legionella nautarum]KTD35075.1 hypothetical protein Lnau_1965 [Legionella nautarum]
MPIEDKMVDEDTKSAGAKIVKVAKWCLTVDDLDIKKYCKTALDQLSSLLSGAKAEDYLKILEEEELLALGNQLEESLSQISTKVTKMKKDLVVLQEAELEKKRANVIKEKETNDRAITDIRTRCNYISQNEQPTFWPSYLADNNPGFFKSIILFFIPQSFIDDAKESCNKFDEKLRVLEKEIRTLEEKKERLAGDVYNYECQIVSEKKLADGLSLLQESKTSLGKTVNDLKAAINILLPQNESEENEFAETNDDQNDDDLTANPEDDDEIFVFEPK